MAISELNQLKSLDFNKQLAFAYLTCERLYPNYIYFSKHYKFGDPKLLRQALDLIDKNLLGNNVDKTEIISFAAKIEENTPQPADYDTILASSALDACAATIEALHFLVDKQFSHIDTISTQATDTVDMYIYDQNNLDCNTDKNYQEKIYSNPLMIKEIATQKGIISYLAKIDSIQNSDITTLISLQENNKGNLNLKEE